MHFAHSLFYLFLIMLLTAGYVAVASGAVCGLWVLLRRLFSGHKSQKRAMEGQDSQTPSPEPERRSPGFYKAASVFILGVFLVYHVAFYVQQRMEWMGNDNAHPTAKEYFVAGQVLYGFRAVLTRFLHPENPLLAPLNGLQQKIYAQGVQLLPEEDGERYVWEQLWFLYPYTRTLRETKDGDRRKYSPDMVKLLDRCWECLEGMAIQPFADRQMEREQYYRNYPGLAFYYNLKRPQYLKTINGALWIIAQDPVRIERTEHLIGWLEKLKQKWQADLEMVDTLRKHPPIAVARQEALMGSLIYAIETVILEKSFGCNHPYIKLYIKTRNDFVGSRERPSPLMRMRNAKQREYHYDAQINWVGARFYKRTLPLYCGYEVAGEESNTKFDKFIGWDEKINRLFKKEIQLIKEAGYGK